MSDNNDVVISDTPQPVVHGPTRSFAADTGTSVPLIQVSSFEHELSRDTGKAQVLPELPSHKFRFTVWHELRSTQVKGDQLKAPRVREGPEAKENILHNATDDEGELIHHNRTGRERSQYRDQQENWEAAVKVNLSYQKLEHAYQTNNLLRILSRLRSVEDLTLIDNSLNNLSRLSFSRCRVANFSKNYLSSFKDLPSMPSLTHLIIKFNQIKDTSGLSRYRKLESLDLFGNGICYSLGYRQRVFAVLPNLKVLDGVLRTEADSGSVVEDENPESSCTIL